MAITKHSSTPSQTVGPPPSSLLRKVIGWTQLVLGMGLAVVAGVWVGRAWAAGTAFSWVIGLGSLAFGVTVAVMGIRRSAVPKQQSRQYRPPTPASVPRGPDGRALPLLGDMLVNKYQLLTPRQLQEALKEQRDRGGRLGQILVALGYLEYPQLVEVLEDQLSYGDPWRRASGRGRAGAEEKVLIHSE